MKKAHLFLLILIALPLIAPGKSDAIPAFAKKYGFNCMMCHTAYPKLNDWGQRFRDNGYQLPAQQGKEKNIFDTPPPIALRTSTGFNGYDTEGGTTGGFDLNGLDLLAAGVLHKNVSVLLIYTPRIDEPTADYTGSSEAQPGALESASVIFSNVIPDVLNVRVGRFEPSYHPVSSKRSYYLMEPYEVYGFVPRAGQTFVFDDNQVGIEATGHFKMGFKYGLGVVNGTGATPDNNKFKDVYVNLSQTIGAGDGQSAGQRFGVFAYYGKMPLEVCDTCYVSPTGEGMLSKNDAFYRYGASGSLNWKTLNLQVVYMRGVDAKAFNPVELDKEYEFNGGFAEVDYAGLWNNRLVASALYNWIAPPDYDKNKKLSAYSALMRYYMGDWTAVNVALHAEYTYRQTGDDNPFKENIYSMLVDFAF
jgi:hypothetical protein